MQLMTSPTTHRRRYWPVSDCLFFTSSIGVPSNTTSPPLLPPSGPRSMIQIRVPDHIEVVLDHDDAVSLPDEPVHDREQMRDVRHVQSSRRFIHDEDAAIPCAAESGSNI